MLGKKESSREVVRLLLEKKEYCPETVSRLLEKKEHCPEVARHCPPKKRRAKRCVFDGRFGDRGMRFCLGGGTQKKAGRTCHRCVPPKSNVIKVVTKSRVDEFSVRPLPSSRCDVKPYQPGFCFNCLFRSI